MGVAWKQCQNHVKAGKTIQSNLTLLHSISKCCLTWASCPSHSFSKKAAWPCMRRSPKGWFQERHYFVVSVTVIKEVMWEPHHGSNCYRCDSVPSCSSTWSPISPCSPVFTDLALSKMNLRSQSRWICAGHLSRFLLLPQTHQSLHFWKFN